MPADFHVHAFYVRLCPRLASTSIGALYGQIVIVMTRLGAQTGLANRPSARRDNPGLAPPVNNQPASARRR